MVSKVNLKSVARGPQANFIQLTQRARDGAVADIYALVDAIRRSPHLATLEVLEVLCSHLNGSSVPDVELPLPKLSTTLAIAGRGLACLSGIRHFLSTKPAPAPIIRAWPGIFRWILFLSATNGCSSEVSSETTAIITQALYYLLQHLSLETLSETPGIVALVTDLWIREDDTTTPLRIPYASGCLIPLIFGTSDAIVVREVIRIADGDAKWVADLAASRLDSALREHVLPARHVAIYVELIRGLLRGGHATLRRALLQRWKGVSFVTEALLKVSYLLAKGTVCDNRNLLNTVAAGLSFLADVLDAKGSILYLVRMVKEGLLQVFANIGALCDQFNEDIRMMMLKLIEHSIPCHLVYESVVFAIGTALRQLDPESRSRIGGSSFKDAWDMMVGRYQLGSYVWACRREATKDIVCCANSHKHSKTSSMKRYSSRHCVWGCSAECRPDDHDTDCQFAQSGDQTLRVSIPETETGSTGFRSPSQNDIRSGADDPFRAALARYEVQRKVAHLRGVAAASHPDTPAADLGVRVSYATMPPVFSVFLLDDFKAGSEVLPPSYRAMQAVLSERHEKGGPSAQRGTLVEYVVFRGGGVERAVTLLQPPLWDAASEEP